MGNGTAISVGHDRWVPTGTSLTTPSSWIPDRLEMAVSELIDHTTGRWNLEVLQWLFDDDTVTKIVSIPFSAQWPIDRQYWWLTKNGEYTVKSGYWIDLFGPIIERGAANDDRNRKMWNTLRSLQAPPKLKQFLWRACKGSLATKWVLY